MAAIGDDVKQYRVEDNIIEKGLVKAQRVSGRTAVPEVVPNAKDRFTLDNLANLVNDPGASRHEPEVRDHDRADFTWGAEVKPWRSFEVTEDELIDFDALAPVEERFFSEGDAYSLESAKRRGATARKRLDSVVEVSMPYRSMSNRNVGQYDLGRIQKDILYDFIDRNAESLAKSSGIRGFFTRRKLKSDLDTLTRTACLWHLDKQNPEKIQDDYAEIHDGVMGVLDTLMTNKSLAKAYSKGATVEAAKEAVDKALLSYAVPLRSGFEATGEDFDAIGEKYVRASDEYADVQVCSRSRSWLNRAVATAGLVVSLFAMGGPTQQVAYEAGSVTGDENIVEVGTSKDIYVSYAVEPAELPDAYDPAPVREAPSDTIPAPRPQRSGSVDGLEEAEVSVVSDDEREMLDELSAPSFRDPVNACLYAANQDPSGSAYDSSCWQG